MYVKELSVRLTEDGKVPPDMGPEKLQELEVLVQDLVRERAQAGAGAGRGKPRDERCCSIALLLRCW